MSGLSGKAALCSTMLVVTLLGGCCCQMEQPAPGPDVAAAAPTTVTEVFALSSEQLFDFDQATLRSEAAFTLSTMVEKYRGNARLRSITVTGHTDSVGADTYNQSLSQRRADSVRNYLVERGVDGSKISAVGKGESSPTASNDTVQGRQLNRRVELSAELEHEVTRSADANPNWIVSAPGR
ncbi:MAG: OmpA family protein [Gammaproteobacteria bacterium]|jgi:outer membrane protein OmpA-like peptidoglycan-associated protein|nr:OmpA family protein [Gammaproteobacteria bacterium]MBP6053680.1 OmpA family protein [Pseudomonadales bacterium]MBK6584326.1 OmpA family protein [Gammaproteobacteria bacterium]MBK7168430.1 OmpA family protein [Gammaproteobacteria bacterium]MBK7520787.1 OmpA family protein [Gammaproteobacteria bacterium]